MGLISENTTNCYTVDEPRLKSNIKTSNNHARVKAKTEMISI